MHLMLGLSFHIHQMEVIIVIGFNTGDGGAQDTLSEEMIDNSMYKLRDYFSDPLPGFRAYTLEGRHPSLEGSYYFLLDCGRHYKSITALQAGISNWYWNERYSLFAILTTEGKQTSQFQAPC